MRFIDISVYQNDYKDLLEKYNHTNKWIREDISLFDMKAKELKNKLHYQSWLNKNSHFYQIMSNNQQIEKHHLSLSLNDDIHEHDPNDMHYALLQILCNRDYYLA